MFVLWLYHFHKVFCETLHKANQYSCSAEKQSTNL